MEHRVRRDMSGKEDGTVLREFKRWKVSISQGRTRERFPEGLTLGVSDLAATFSGMRGAGIGLDSKAGALFLSFSQLPRDPSQSLI